MEPTLPALAEDLIAMASRDADLRAPAGRHGVVFTPDDDRERAISVRHADRLAEIVATHGWPGRSRVGEEGAAAAWVVAMRAGDVVRMKAWSVLVEQAAHLGETDRHHVAHLMDRIRVLQGKEQVYGTQFRRGPDGTIAPYPTTRLDTIDDRRGSVQLDPLDDTTAALNAAR